MTFKQLSELQEYLLGVDKNDAQKYAAIIIIICDVENSTSIHLSIDERKALAKELLKLNESIPMLLDRAEKVKRDSKKYGRIGFDIWFHAGVVYTDKEIDEEVNRRIARRKRDYLMLNAILESEEEQIAKEGLEEVKLAYLRRADELRNRLKEGFEKRCRKAKAFIYSCDESMKNEILELAIDKGLIVKDEFWRQSLPFLAPLMLDEVEKIMKRK